MARPPKRPSIEDRPAQPAPEDLVETLLNYIGVHWYPNDRVQFLKDRKILLKWVVLKFARWLTQRGVTLSADRYQEIVLEKILKPALVHGRAMHFDYVPAYLGKVVESHLAAHGDEYYDEAKSVRSQLEQVMRLAGKAGTQPAADPIRELATAARLLQRPKKQPSKLPVNGQLRQVELL